MKETVFPVKAAKIALQCWVLELMYILFFKYCNNVIFLFLCNILLNFNTYIDVCMCVCV